MPRPCRPIGEYEYDNGVRQLPLIDSPRSVFLYKVLGRNYPRMNHIWPSRVFETLMGDNLLTSGIFLPRLRPKNSRNLPFHLDLGARKPSYRVHVNADLNVNKIDKFFDNAIVFHSSICLNDAAERRYRQR
jgi:hypothetical protein